MIERLEGFNSFRPISGLWGRRNLDDVIEMFPVADKKKLPAWALYTGPNKLPRLERFRHSDMKVMVPPGGTFGAPGTWRRGTVGTRFARLVLAGTRQPGAKKTRF